jgi:hypothetical protein
MRSTERPGPRPIVSVVGSGVADPMLDELATQVGAALGRAGATVVCGGLGGVMAAVCRGAQQAGGLTVGILPGGDRADANPFVDVALATALGEARNVLVARAGAAVIAIGGSFGTLSEIAIARKLGTTVVALRSWPLLDDEGIVHVATPAEAADRALAIAHG